RAPPGWGEPPPPGAAGAASGARRNVTAPPSPSDTGPSCARVGLVASVHLLVLPERRRALRLHEFENLFAWDDAAALGPRGIKRAHLAHALGMPAGEVVHLRPVRLHVVKLPIARVLPDE